MRGIDRTRKGIRGALRDAMLARFASATDRGRIFGFHRAMDHTGAILGPLVAAAIAGTAAILLLFVRTSEQRML